MIRLSICIPSYNRAKFLPDLLRSITSQYDERVEIHISDNGSIDETTEIVRNWQQHFPRIYYERFAHNVGPDRCFLRSVELASGTFCWLMGDDDIIEPGALSRVLDLLQDSFTGITVHRNAYDSSLQKRIKESPALSKTELFTNSSSCLSAIFPLLGFLSAQIVHREKWTKLVREEKISPYFNAYSLVYIIGRMIQKDPSWLYLHEPCVGWRSGNDSFAKELGRSRRLALDITSYTSIAQGLFANTPLPHKKVLHQVCSIHLLGHVRDLLFQYKEPFVFRTFALCLPRFYHIPFFWIKFLPLLFLPRSLAKIAQVINNKLK